MICGACKEKNREGARFCLSCGASLALRCLVCDAELPAGARFCDSCGTPVDAAVASTSAAPAAARKVVTVLFADLTGSTALEERLDAETVRPIIDRFYSTLRTETERHGGRVVKFTGDGVMSVFGLPDVREDDAARAVDAALAMRNECADLSADLGIELAIKVGVNTGEVVVSETDEDVVGDCVNVAARLEGAAPSGEIYVGEETWRLTRGSSRFAPVPPLTLKGKSEPVPTYRLLSIDERTADSAAAPFVGRDRELGRMLATFEDAVASRSARLITIIGSPGLGKTRLARELMGELEGDARVREARCDPADSTFAPIADALRGAAQIADAASEDEILDALRAMLAPDDPDAERIAARAAAILGAGVPGTTEETFWALRRLVESAAQVAPVVLVFDDLHWAEPLLLDLIEHLAEWVKDAPVVIVGTGRPELRDLRPSLAEGGRAAAVIALEGLDDAATARLALNLLGTDDLPGELLTKIPASTEGNPLFVRELVRMLVDDGVLLRGADGWRVTVDVDAIQVPPTIQSLLAARVDRLRPDERTFIELAAVVGKEFYRGALHELAPAAVREHLDGCLESLRRKELIEPSGTYWIDEPVYHFHHALIRDAAYRRVLKEMRADVHERVAQWLEDKTQDVLGEHDELIGYHFEQAHEYRAQLGRQDDVLARRAAELLGTASTRALDRDDLPAAASLSGRALARLPEDDPSRPELLLVRCEALLSMGDVTNGASAVAELEETADTPRLVAWAQCFAGQLANMTSPERLRETGSLVAEAAVRLAELGDQAGAAKAHTVHAATLARLGRFAECEAVLDAGLNAARSASDRRRITAVLGAAPHATLWGPNPVSRAGGRCLDIIRLLRITTGSLAVEAASNRCQAVLEAFRGRADAARKMLRNSRRPLVELGLDHELLEADLFAGIIEIVSGDVTAAEPFLTSAYEGFSSEGVDVLAAQAAALLARTHLSLGEEEEAERFASASERLGGQDLKASIAWRAVKAEMLARRGEHDEARSLAEAAVEIASSTDALIDHADACRALSVVCAAAGDAAAARSAKERALALYERKGATAFAGSVAVAVEPAPAAARLENAAVIACDVYGELIAQGEVDRFVSYYADDAVLDDRRRGISGVARGTEQIRVLIGALFDIGTSAFRFDVIAIRGDRLALVKGTYSASGPSAFAVDALLVIEVDARGRFTAVIAFDEDAFDAASAELDARYERLSAAATRGQLAENRASRAFIAMGEAIAARDWPRVAACLTTDVRFEDARAGLGAALRGVDPVVDNFRIVMGFGVETVSADIIATRGDHLVLGRVKFAAATADLVTESFAVAEVDDSGLFKSACAFDDLDEALAKLDELDRTHHGTGAVENAASRAVDREQDAYSRRDWDAYADFLAPDVVVSDKRLGFSFVSTSRSDYVAGGKELAALDAVVTVEDTLATRGERLVLQRFHFQGANDFEVVLLALSEIDDRGRIVARVLFDLDKSEVAFAELDERYAAHASQPASANRAVAASERRRDALFARDWTTYEAAFAPGSVLEDRRAGMGSVVRGVPERRHHDEVLLDIGVTIAEHIPVAVRGDRLALMLLRVRGSDTDNYAELLMLDEIDETDRNVATLLFDIDAADAAYRELDERHLAVERVPPSATTFAASVVEREVAAFNERDWGSVAELVIDDVELDDRRRGFAFRSMGRDAYLESYMAMVSVGAVARLEEIVATRGGRLVLHRARAGSDADAPAVEVFTLLLTEIDEQGRIVRRIVFDPDAEDEAFDELNERYAAGEGAAWRETLDVARRFIDAHRHGRWEEATSCLAEALVFVDHREASVGDLHGRSAYVDATSSLMDLLDGGRTRIEAIHAIAEDRILDRVRITGENAGGGRVDIQFDALGIIREGLLARIEIFPVEQLEDALSAFRRGEAPANAATRMVDAFMDLANRGDIERAFEHNHPDVVIDDRRPGLRTRIVGREAGLRNLRNATGGGARIGWETLATRGDHLALVLTRWTGTRPSEYLVELLNVFEVDDRGLCTSCVQFEGDALDEAYAELDARHVVGEAASDPFERNQVIAAEVLATGDWDLLPEFLSDDVVLDDRRSGVSSVGRGIDAYQRNWSAIRDLGMRFGPWEVLARRGATLVLVRGVLVDPDGNEFGGLVVNEFDAEGRTAAQVFFDFADVDAAYAELDERFAAGEGAKAAMLVRLMAKGARAINERNWDIYDDMLHSEGFVFVDHRPASLGTFDNGGDLTAAQRSMVELVPDLRVEGTAFEVLLPDRCVERVRITGTGPDGSHLDFSMIVVAQIEDGRGRRFEFFRVEDLDAAIARCEELGQETALQPVATMAVAAGNRLHDAFDRQDWDAFGALLAPDSVFEDNRTGFGGFRIEGRDARVENMRAMVGVGGIGIVTTTLATRGERLLLTRFTVGSRSDFHAEFLQLDEYTDEGLLAISLLYDLDDLDAAFKELDRRFIEGEGRPFADVLLAGERQREAVERADLDQYRALHAPDTVLVDHRPSSLGTVQGIEEVLAAITAFTPLVHQVRLRVVAYHAIDTDRTLTEVHATGTDRQGAGTIEMALLRLQCWRDGVVSRVELFPVDALDAARRRFGELGSSGLSNTCVSAKRASDSFHVSGQLDAFAATFADPCFFSDRRPVFRGDNWSSRERLKRSAQAILEVGTERIDLEPIAIRGERLALVRRTFRARKGAGFEVETVNVVQLDEEGLIEADIAFEPTDLDDAFEELDQRFIALHEAPIAADLRLSKQMIDAFNARDWEAYERLLSSDFRVVDHRPASLGELSREGLLEANTTIVELVPSIRARTREWLATQEGVNLSEVAIVGTSPQGDPIDLSLFALGLMRDGHIHTLEYFPPDRRVDALRRFEELSAADAHQSLENAVVRTYRAAYRAASEREEGWAERYFSPDVVHSDRRSGLTWDISGEALLRAAETTATHSDETADVVAVRGERLALIRQHTRHPNGWELEAVSLIEQDDEGRIAHVVTFDPHDVDVAVDELDDRYAAGEGSVFATDLLRSRTIMRAMNTLDGDILRSIMAPDCRMTDHRPASFGDMSGEDYIEAMTAIRDLTPEFRFVLRRFIGLEHGLSAAEVGFEGRTADGMTVERTFIGVELESGGRLFRMEVFGEDQRDDAVARFRELAALSGGNRTTATNDAFLRAFHAHDWSALADTVAVDFARVDHRTGLGIDLIGRAACVEVFREWATLGFRIRDPQVVAIRGENLALHHVVTETPDGFVVELLVLAETDDDGRTKQTDYFDVHDVDAALEELDDRFAAGEGRHAADAVRFGSAFFAAHNRRDADAFRRMLADDLVLIDHRPAYLGEVRDPDVWVDSIRQLWEMSSTYRSHIVRYIRLTAARGLAEIRSTGTTDDGSEFEIVFLGVVVLRGARLARLEIFPPDAEDEAAATYEAVTRI